MAGAEVLGGVAIGMTLLGGITSAVAGRQAAKANASTLDWNAAIADLQEQDAIDRGWEAVGRSRVNYRTLLGQQRAAYSDQGIQLDTGSAADVQTETAVIGEREAQIVANNAAREAWGFRSQAAGARIQARALRAGMNAGTAGTLLGTGAQAGGLAYQMARG